MARLVVAQRSAGSPQAALPRAQVPAHPGAPPQSPPLPPAPTAVQVTLVGGASELHPAAAGSAVPADPQTAAASPLLVAKDVSDGLEQLLAQVKQLQAEKGSLPAELSGRLEGLLARLQQLPQPGTTGTAVLPGLEQLSGQLTQIVQQEVVRPQSGQLGLLSQLFGFHLEAELLSGKAKAALASLKLSLLELREELGGTVKEPLQRLELLQLSKARLAEEQVQFLPLLFPELEEGYLLVEKRREQGEGQESEPPLQLSISLRLAALGDLRIDMLYEQQGLHLRVACEDQEKMTYLQGCTAELTAALETVPLQGVSFAADAKQPIRTLRERLVPESLGMLDARI